MNPFHWLLPWEFSPSVMVCCSAAVILFARGSRGESGCAATTSRWRQVSFYLGTTLIYVPLQTRFDYFAQHMFWIHRLQHLLLHHIGPFLVALSAPWSSMSRGLPVNWRSPVITVIRSAPTRGLYGILQQPLIALTLFVGLIYFWLWPGVHFRAMLSANEVRMDELEHGARWIAVLVADSGPTVPRGRRANWIRHTRADRALCNAASIADRRVSDVSCDDHLRRVYRLRPVMAGRSDNRSADRGLITWIPACMMSVVGALIALRRWMYDDTRARAARKSAGIDAVLTASELR